MNPPDSITEASPAVAVPRRLLCYSGASWNSQLLAIGKAAWFKNCTVANKGAVDFWLWVCDASGEALAPTMAPIYVPALTTQSIDRTLSPRFFGNGIYVCATTDPQTRTLITAGDAFFELSYEIEL